MTGVSPLVTVIATPKLGKGTSKLICSLTEITLCKGPDCAALRQGVMDNEIDNKIEINESGVRLRGCEKIPRP
uniref:Uncharacterized protein n=1 Tax=Candidatus Kentrum sp. FM TaxID=2126340 RepID=A0A450S5M1_9GAMM|nr:MAG: hypothetical protein BECKFM1743C_GA0114222_100422 [Candidatus Kentron sp. FM]VFK08423.1 MAG: hypothetical protein BECKFM1743B_GA0114221_100694 [Candidatus Kentron sp. FM]